MEKINYSNEALEYIAKLADGGMRDAITMMDKCLSFSTELTVENVVKALGVADYDTMMKLTDVIFAYDKASMIQIIEEVHASGVELKQFVKQYIQFILDVCKYGTTGDFTYTTIPSTSDNKLWLDNLDWNDMPIDNLLTTLIKLSADIKYESSPKYLIEAVLLERIEHDRTGNVD